MDERILMEKIAGGDEAALHALLRQYGPLIRYIIAPIVPDAHDREDCFSEVTLRIWEKADRFAPPARQLEGMSHRRHAEHGL